MGIQFCC